MYARSDLGAESGGKDDMRQLSPSRLFGDEWNLAQNQVDRLSECDGFCLVARMEGLVIHQNVAGSDY